METKVCTVCGKALPLHRFSWSTAERRWRRGDCKSCVAGKARERQAADPDYRTKHRFHTIASQYKVRKPQWEQMYQEQDGKCLICSNPIDAFSPIDHDHSCCAGAGSCGSCVRGILCSQCNTGLANFRDRPELLEAAAAYLRR